MLFEAMLSLLRQDIAPSIRPSTDPPASPRTEGGSILARLRTGERPAPEEGDVKPAVRHQIVRNPNPTFVERPPVTADAEAEWDRAPVPQKRGHGHTVRWMLAAATGAAAAVIALVGWQFGADRGWVSLPDLGKAGGGGATGSARTRASAVGDLDEQSAERQATIKAATDAAERFLTAQSTEDRLAWTYQPSIHRDGVIAYHLERGNVPPKLLQLRHIQFYEDKAAGMAVNLFRAQTADSSGFFAVAVHETPSGPRVDWPFFLQFRLGTFADFLSERPEGAKRFKLIAERAHRGDGVSPSSGDYICVRVQGADAEIAAPAYVFIPSDSDAGRSVEKGLRWSERQALTAKLSWQEDDSGQPILVMTDVERFGW